MMVLEAKKTGRTFGIPNAFVKKAATTFEKLRLAGSADLIEALDQCVRYASHTGALYACATNGQDWVFFKPNHPFRPLGNAIVILFHGVDQIVQRLDEFIELLSPEALQKGAPDKALLGRNLQVPDFAKRLQDSFPYRRDFSIEEEEYSNILDQMLKHYVFDLTTEVDFDECYLPARGNRATSSSLETLISGRLDIVRQAPQQTGWDFASGIVSKPLVPDVASGRTVVLHGQVGVGKTSFLRHCELKLRAANVLEEAVWARIDLLPFADRPFITGEVNFMLDSICTRVQQQVAAQPITERRYCLPVRREWPWASSQGAPPYLEDGSLKATAGARRVRAAEATVSEWLNRPLTRAFRPLKPRQSKG